MYIHNCTTFDNIKVIPRDKAWYNNDKTIQPRKKHQKHYPVCNTFWYWSCSLGVALHSFSSWSSSTKRPWLSSCMHRSSTDCSAGSADWLPAKAGLHRLPNDKGLGQYTVYYIYICVSIIISSLRFIKYLSFRSGNEVVLWIITQFIPKPGPTSCKLLEDFACPQPPSKGIWLGWGSELRMRVGHVHSTLV